MKKLLTAITITFYFQINAQIIATIAGGGTVGLGDGWQANGAQLSYPSAVAIDGSGNYYIADKGDNRIRKVNASGIITTIAGNGAQGYSGDTGPATNAKLYNPIDIAIDPIGNIYIADAGNSCVRKINTSGIITTVAGYISGNSGDGGLATNAKLGYPTDIAFDAMGNLYIADASNNRIRKVNTSNIITTIAGDGTASFGGDGGPATSAQLWQPSGVALDAVGNLYIADVGNNVIRMVNTLGVIRTIAGNDTLGYSGDGGPATNAKLNSPFGVTVDKANNLYIVDGNNYCIRMVNTSGIITTIAGNGTFGFNGDGGPAIAAEFNGPAGIAIDITGNIYIADIGNNRIRFICNTPITVSVNSSPKCVGSTATITATGATYYSWAPSTGLNMNGGNSIILNPTTTTIYTVTGTTVGCKGTATSTVSVNPLPVFTVNTATVCAGNTATLTASGVGTYTYSWNGFTGGATQLLSIIATTHYTVTATDSNSCTSHATTTITALPLPIVTVNTATICAGNTATLTAHGASTYTWSTSDTGAIITPYPIGTTQYIVTGANINNCTNSKTTTVTVNNLPLITVNSFTICTGAMATLTAGSPSPCNYTWNTNQTSNTITPSPSVTTQYIVTGTDANNCAKSRTTTVTVNQIPIVSVTSNTASLCFGATATLTASGANTYTWSTNQTDTNIIITPTINTTYTVTGTDANGCINTDTITQVVINCATTNISQAEVNSNQILIYPNPNTGTFIIETNSFEKQTVQLFDVNGKLVLSQSINNKTSIDANNLNEGVYNVSIVSSTGVVNKRIVIVR